MKAWVQIPLLTNLSLGRCSFFSWEMSLWNEYAIEIFTLGIGDGGIVVSMVAFQAIDPSSILGHRNPLFNKKIFDKKIKHI
ncbi:hypothetical protein GHT06_001523 [Daphnia sinensis]|uniref:Uncharacterized protein n=1 Tax=Daphnia sinensis TaxID=1820382 RepID=A0AAD5KEP6_9CRUS|nr:hypothetical protein GHT06_001523 [Daphnia sinensis]